MLTELSISAFVAVIVCLLFYAGLTRRLWNLQCDLASTQAQFLKLRNAQAAGTRWKDKEQLEMMKDLQQTNNGIPNKNPLEKFGIKRVG